MENLKAYADVVRIVDPTQTIVYENTPETDCDMHSCFSIWGKTGRCSNCTSLRAFEEKSRITKLERSDLGLFFVASQYVPYGELGAVMEMVTKVEE